ncbi:hypothetical protein EG329_007636 [Mollisiaceae sp. DMI_Dod_QoI]|nr:hypothetical protein EG329_007636 [Helotiales sp. DMI_Dod_QoI]
MACDKTGSTTCSDFSFTWGKLYTNSIQHIGYLTCNESAETVAVNTTLFYPSLSFDPDHPPTPDESTTTLSHATLPPLKYSFNYHPNEAAVFGVNGVPLEHLSNPANDQDVIDRITHLHKLIRAQQFTNYPRIILNNTSRLGAPITANITDPNRLRIVQDATSTHILEGLLATILLCAVIAGILMDTRKTISKNSCSIAAVGSLLADSNLMDALPKFERADEKGTDEREVAKRLGLGDKSVVFRIGWMGEVGKGSTGRDGLVYGIQMVRLAGRESGEISKESKSVVMASTTPEPEAETMLS